MSEVWKYPVAPDGAIRWDVMMPEGALFRHIAMQHREMQMWFEVDPLAPRRHRLFEIVGTGQPVPKEGWFLGSFLSDAVGTFVFHLYEVTP